MTRLPSGRRCVCVLVLGVLCSAVLVEQGCYRRVVGARGLGASNYEISQPYQENSRMDDWVFGEKPTTDRIVRPRPQE